MSSEQLSEILLASDCESALLEAIETGEMDSLVPELLLLSMEQDPIHRHKDVSVSYTHLTLPTKA